MIRSCSTAGCSNAHYARGCCRRHYDAARGAFTPDRGRATPEERFQRGLRTEPGGCVVWRRAGSTHKAFNVRGGVVGVHRFAWEFYFGPVPEGLWVLHTCDNPPCVNPEHLFLGTHDDNMADRSAKGRAPRGEGCRNARLTDALVREIRASTEVSRVLAERLGVSGRAIRSARSGRSWKHVAGGSA